jgi:Dolichyl-phosphate-mannose-protein mannosyltransferase
LPVVAPVAAITLLALLLRLPGLGDSVFGDELFTYELATRPGFGDMLHGVTGPLEISPPLYFAFAWVCAKLGDPHVWIRVPSLVAGVALVPATYALGVRTLGRTAALVGATLLALSPFAIFYSTEARAYTLATLFVLLAALALLAATEHGGWRRWGLFALAACAALYSHYTAAFPLAAEVAWAAWAHRDRLRELALACLAVGAGLLPWLPSFLDDRTAGFQTAIENINPLTVSFFLRSLGIAVAGNPYATLRETPGRAVLLLLALGLVLALAGAVAARTRLVARLRAEPPIALVLALAVASPLGAALYSIPFASVYVPRTLLPSLCAFCLVVGLLVAAAPRRIAVPAAIVTIVALALGTVELYREQPKLAYNDAAAWIDERRGPGDPVLQVGLIDYGSLDAHLDEPFRLYKQGCADPTTEPGQILVSGIRCTGGDEGYRRALAGTPRHVFVVAYGQAGRLDIPGLARGYDRASAHLFEQGLFPIQVREYARR